MVGDEIHFLTVCKRYGGLRSELFQEISKIETGFSLISNKDKRITLLASKILMYSFIRLNTCIEPGNHDSKS